MLHAVPTPASAAAYAGRVLDLHLNDVGTNDRTVSYCCRILICN